MAGSPATATILGLRSSFLKGAATALCAVAILATGLIAVFGQGMQTSGICFANPLGRTSLWPYDPASNSLTLTYYFAPSRNTSFGRKYVSVATTAFRAWSKAWPVLRFSRVDSAAEAQIVITSGKFGTRGKWYDHAGLTIPDVEMFGCGLTHAMIEINDTYLVHDGALEYPLPMLRHLLVHEIGHALGLKHVYQPVASVMIPTSGAYRYVRPQRYDVRTLAGLYPSAIFARRLSVRRPHTATTTAQIGLGYRSAPLGLDAHN
jgi:Matrixin